MQLKAYMVDARLLRTGSANFSASGLKRQENDLLLIEDQALVRAFGDTFERIWDQSVDADKIEAAADESPDKWRDRHRARP